MPKYLINRLMHWRQWPSSWMCTHHVVEQSCCDNSWHWTGRVYIFWLWMSSLCWVCVRLWAGWAGTCKLQLFSACAAIPLLWLAPEELLNLSLGAFRTEKFQAKSEEFLTLWFCTYLPLKQKGGEFSPGDPHMKWDESILFLGDQVFQPNIAQRERILLCNCSTICDSS